MLVKPASNSALSKNRTLDCKKIILVKKGVEPDRIKAEWFGHINDCENTTPEGRTRKNRTRRDEDCF